MPEPAQILRIVVASPSDVDAGRKAVSTVVAQVNCGVAGERGLVLKLSQWEKDAFPGLHAKGPQALIDAILRIPECDIFLGIFWRRFGAPVTDARSGTEHEYRLAYEAWRQEGRPQILFYFNQRPYSPKTMEEIDQWRMVLEFRENFPKEGLWWPYVGKEEFKTLLRDHLENFLRRKYPIIGPVPSQAGPPVGRRFAPEEGFVCTDFASVEQLSLVEEAGADEHVLRLTPAAPFMRGAAWWTTPQYVKHGFDTVFELRLSKQDEFYGGGDGLAFVIQDSAEQAIGGFGASLGFGTDTGFKIPGIPNSLAVVLDTFRNPEAPFNDPSGNYVAVHTNGAEPNNSFSITRLAHAILDTINLKDGNAHSVEVNCIPGILEVLIDTRLILAVPLTIADRLRLSGGKAFLGFTAATASSFQNHDILKWVFRSRPAPV